MSEPLRREREPRNPEDVLFGIDSSAEPTDEANRAGKPSPFEPSLQARQDDTVHVYALIHTALQEVVEPAKDTFTGTTDHSEKGYQVQNKEPETVTGYAIRFVPESMANLPIYDVLASEILESTPLLHQTLESLPLWARTKLRREGHLRCAGEYNRETDQFETFSLEWKDHPTNQADTLAQILKEVGSEHFVAAVYYFLYTNASKPNASPEALASLRDIQSSSVMNSIREVEDRLENSSL
ncbi:hypothetical protein [Haloarcula sp. H-GB5]